MKLGVPRIGIYSNIFKSLVAEAFNSEVIMPPRVSREIIEAGVANSSDMMCFPYKVTLGQEIWALEHGATDIIMYNTCEACRFKHYHQLQDQTLKKLGYHFNMHTLTKWDIPKMVMRVCHFSPFNIYTKCKKIYSDIKKVEAEAYPDTGHIKVGIVGELYTILEQDINFDIVRKLQRMDVNVHMSLTLSELVERIIKAILKLEQFDDRRSERKEAKQLLTQVIGGHGRHSIVNTIWYGKNGFDGVIHLMPLSCMPESTVEVLVDRVADKYGIPLYRFPIDENNFEKGFNTRLETFVSMLKRRKNK